MEPEQITAIIQCRKLWKKADICHIRYYTLVTMQLSKYESDYLYLDSMAAAHKLEALYSRLARKTYEQRDKSPFQL